MDYRYYTGNNGIEFIKDIVIIMNSGIDKKTKILVVGLGFRSGLAACNFLAERDYSVTACDLKEAKLLSGIIEKLDGRVNLVTGSQHPSLLDEGFDLVVLSPGVPVAIDLVQAALKRGIPVISEIELAYRFMKGGIIAITGTDGKSTTTMLAAHICTQLGFKSAPAGNIGIPLISLVDRTREDFISVVELSSFQLETIHDFRPDVGVLMNVTPDHLDRYSGMEEYFSAKMNITRKQTEEDYFIINGDDIFIREHIGSVAPRLLRFSLEDETADAFWDGRYIFIRDGAGRTMVCDTTKINLIGVHNIQNTMAAVLAVMVYLKKKNIAVAPDKIAEACYSFHGLPHRMEPVASIKGRQFINDSKATTVGSVQMALRSVKERCVLIMGGQTKGDDYSRLISDMENRVRTLVLIGESSNEFSKIFSTFNPVLATSMEEAVQKAFKYSKEGDDILLSPGCASFDMFDSFEHRGEIFKKAVESLKRGNQ